MTRYGDRLVFSNGIVVLSAFAILLLIVFQASVTKLIPLYAIGVFTSFTFSQAGMAKRHRTLREPGWKKGLAINGFGALVTAAMTVIIAATKFLDGAWIILIAIPVMLGALLRVNRHYVDAADALDDVERRGPVRDLPRQRVVIPVHRPGPEDAFAVAYARRLFPLETRIVHFAPEGTSIDFMWDGWGHLGEIFELRPRTKRVAHEIRNLARELRTASDGDEVINVIVPNRSATEGGGTCSIRVTCNGSSKGWSRRPTWWSRTWPITRATRRSSPRATGRTSVARWTAGVTWRSCSWRP